MQAARIDLLAAALGHEFREPELLIQALTHKSHSRPHNERLEFLGDALLNHAVAEVLFRTLPFAREGDLTRLRAEVVRESTLADVARVLALGDHLRLGPGELKSGGFRRASILADAVEALIGAVYLDAGWDACSRVVDRLLSQRIADAAAAGAEKDAKTRLQEWLQARGHGLPVYVMCGSSGDEHDKTFHVRCEVPGLGVSADGEGASRRAAETTAAERALALVDGAAEAARSGE
jgi:ribonuclease-3